MIKLRFCRTKYKLNKESFYNHIFATMKNKYIFVFLLLTLVVMTVGAENTPNESKIEPPDWYKAGVVAALQDRTNLMYDELTFIKERKEWLPTYLSSEERKIIVNKFIKQIEDKNTEGTYGSNAIEVTIDGLIQLQAKEAIPKFLLLLKDDHFASERSFMISTVIKALGRLHAKEAIPQITQFLIDEDPSIRSSAIEAISQLEGKTAIPQITAFLKDKDESIISKSIETLARLQAAEAISQISLFLKNENPDIRFSAIDALTKLQAKEAIPKFMLLLKEKDEHVYIRSHAIWALTQLQTTAAIQQIILLLKDAEPSIRCSAIDALARLQVKKAIPKIIPFLKDENSSLRYCAIDAFAQLEGKNAIPQITPFLKDKDESIISKSIETLARLKATEAIPQISLFLEYPGNSNGLIISAMMALADLQGEKAIIKILPFIDDKGNGLGINAIQTLIKLQTEEQQLLQPLIFSFLRNLLAPSYSNLMMRSPIDRFYAHVAAGTRYQPIVWCLGDHDPRDCSNEVFEKDYPKTLSTFELLQSFYKTIPQDRYFLKLRNDLVKKMQMLADVLVIQQDEMTLPKLFTTIFGASAFSDKYAILFSYFSPTDSNELIEKNIDLLKDQPAYTDNVNSVKASLQKIEEKQKDSQRRIAFTFSLLAHLSFWTILIFIYPRSRMVQAIFFWNPWVRRIVGLGYVGFFLTWIPFLRRRLLSAFKKSLLADADLNTFKPDSYFSNMSVTFKNLTQSEPMPILNILDDIDKSSGQIILEGASGLGKTMFLRYLAEKTKRDFAFLKANRCNEGVIIALQNILHGFAKNETFLTNIIYAGGIEICIDGLNEVSPDTRARITIFAEKLAKANIILTTQPLEWTPPAIAKSYKLLPLNQSQIESFLLTRPYKNNNYEELCRQFLQDVTSLHLQRDLRELHQRILSNTMDLTLVAQLLDDGIQPNLTNLAQQQYERVDEEYQEQYFGKPFPLKKFSKYAFEVRLNDNQKLDFKEFSNEINVLSNNKHKMTLKRIEIVDDKKQDYYFFRHDKIWDFFIAYHFSQQSDEWMQDYFKDERFRGAFLALAWSLPVDRAKTLLNDIQHYAAITSDNILHNQYYQLIDLRKRTADTFGDSV